MSFSQNVKNEYCALPWEDLCCLQTEIMAALVSSAKFRQNRISLSTSHGGCAKRLKAIIAELYDADVLLSRGRELYNITVDHRKDYDEIVSDLIGKFRFDPIRGTVHRSPVLTDCCRKAFLRGIFLAGGSLNEPLKSYHMEIAIRRMSVAQTAKKILEEEEIHASMIRRSGYLIIAINDAQQISDFLLITGAHAAMLEFESLRVDKSIRNSVNRVVNCDNANSTRIAYTSARQTQAVEYIIEHIGLHTLPADLTLTAKLRLENPDLSLKELSELTNPPISKSGINHRLKKIEKIAQDHKKKENPITTEVGP
jgi:cell division protein WhiA